MFSIEAVEEPSCEMGREHDFLGSLYIILTKGCGYESR
jgi:hypothetical protein